MPKITNQKVHRLHIAIPHSEYLLALNLAKENHTSISEILRTCLKLLINSPSEKVENFVEVNKNEKTKIFSISPEI